MKRTKVIMGMPVSVDIADAEATEDIFNEVFNYVIAIDERFSTYKATSEITAINEGRLQEKEWGEEMRLIFTLCEETKQQTNGYFDIKTPNGHYDPSGLVKGWAIWNAALLLRKRGVKNFYVDAGGDIQPQGMNAEGGPWIVGIKNPWNEAENIKIIKAGAATNGSGDCVGVATSGIYIRGLHIYNPKAGNEPVSDIVSLTVIGPNIYEADRFATAAFAMGHGGIDFIERLDGFEGYMIDKDKVATLTSGFEKYTT